MKKIFTKLVVITVFLISNGIASSSAYAELVTLSPGDVLEIRFDVPVLPSPDNDMFYIFANGSTVTGYFDAVTLLFDGDTLLGTYTEGYSQITSRWITVNSLSTIGNPQIIDFTSLLNGSIDGLTQMTNVGYNSITFDTVAVQGKFGKAISFNSWYSDPVEARILSVTIIPGGSSLDTDGDEIPDNVDLCPYVFGEAAYDGCPTPQTDRDGDGISDDVDLCPNVFGKLSHDGCSPGRSRTGTADLIPTRLTYSALNFGWGWYNWVVIPRALIENRGYETAKNFHVVFEVVPHSRSVTVKSLEPGESIWISTPKDFTRLWSGEYILRVVVDRHNQVPELDESNNVYQRPIVLGSD